MPEQHVQTKREIQAMLAGMGLRPRKRFGQHFLIDGNLMRRLVSTAELQPDDVILEVGAGTGGLTDLLADHVKELIVVEIDRDLCAMLRERFREMNGMHLLCADVLAGKNRLASEVADLLGELSARTSGSVKLVANLPYQAATPLVMNLLVEHPEVKRLCFTVQAEVAERLTAPPRCKAYGPLSIMAQTLSRIEITASLPPEAFWPRPTINSTMVRMDLIDPPFGGRATVRGLAEWVRGAFLHRRKTLRSALGYIVNQDTRDHVCEQFDATRRPESFTTEEWLAMYKLARR